MWLLLEGSALKQRVRKCYFRNMDDLGFYKKHMNLVSGEDPVSHACVHTVCICSLFFHGKNNMRYKKESREAK